MFDLTVLPYFVFAFMAVPPFIFGYFKGWRSGLFTLGLTIIVGGILIGICFGIYESALWPLFKNMFIQNHNDAGLDIESLKSISKTSVISITVGIALIPSMLLTWGLYMGLKRFLNKYMKPRIKKISNNEVNVSRKNLKLTRAGGVVLNGVAGLIVASAAAGAVSTLVTPSTKSNFFNSLTNTFADGMTFGQGQYSKEYQRMFEFVNTREFNDPTIAGFNNVFAMAQANDGKFGDMPALLTQFRTIAGSDEFIKETNLMAKDSEEISKALVMMLLDASHTQNNFHLVGFDDAHTDGQGTDLAKDKASENNIIASLNALETFTKTQKTGFTWNQDGVKEAVEEIFNKKYIDFEKSPYYQNWKHSTDLLKTAKEELKTRQADLTTTTSKISSERSTQASDVKSFQDKYELTTIAWDKITDAIARIGDSTGSYSDDSIPTMPIFANAPWSSTWTYITDDETLQDKGMIIQGGHDFTPIHTPGSTGSYSKMMGQKVDMQNKEKDYQDKLKLTQDAQRHLDGLNTTLQNYQDALADFQSDKSGAESALKQAETTIANYPDGKARLDKALSDEQTNNGRLTKIGTALATEMVNLKGIQTLAEKAVIAAQGYLDDAEKALSGEQGLTKGLQDTYDQSDKDYTKASDADKKAAADLSAAGAGLDAANANLATANKKVADEQAEVDRINKIHADAVAAAAKITTGPKPIIPPVADETKLKAAKAAVTPIETLQVMADDANTKAIAAKAKTAIALTDASTKRDAAKAALDTNTKNIKTLTTTRDQKQTDLNGKNADKKIADQNVINKAAEISNNQLAVATSVARTKSIQNDIKANEQSLKTAKASKATALTNIATAEAGITKENGLIATQQSKISDEEVIINGTDGKSGLKGTSDKAFATQTNAENLYKKLKGEYDADHMMLQKYKGFLPGYEADATSLKNKIDVANAQLTTDIHHQRVLNDKIDPTDKDYAKEHPESIPYQEDVIKNSDKLLQAALDLKDKQKDLDDKRGKELIELVTKLFS